MVVLVIAVISDSRSFNVATGFVQKKSMVPRTSAGSLESRGLQGKKASCSGYQGLLLAGLLALHRDF